MSNNIESNIPVKFTENSKNEWINWIEVAIAKDYFKYYEFNHFSNFQEIGFGGFGKVYRANWKSSHNYLALKSFSNSNNVTIKEIVKELKIQREVDFHENIIRFCGITTEDQIDNSKKYWLVMEYADGGTLQEYLKEHFDNLTWNNKFNMALQLACAILCLHDEEIIHRDLHSKNVIGILLWEISSGLRETPIPDTPEDYKNVYTDCWNNEPDGRPTINQVVSKLNAMIINNSNNMTIKDFQTNGSYTNIQLSSKQQLNLNAFEDPINNPPHGELSKIIQNFNDMSTKEIDSSISSNNNFKVTVDEMVELSDKTNIDAEQLDRQSLYNYLNNRNITSREIYIWIIDNQNYLNSIVLLGDFNYLGIETNIDKEKAFELYQVAENSGNIIAQYNIGCCYLYGNGVYKDCDKAFELFRKSAEREYSKGKV
ncbi:kinase-like domain-containing protein [Rhizophagus irregularis DAOM 181602=DAOM 197198]|nr:kinase-like domain-containing protein [Rhizophagus irregularis DAOM 181602=DAOM 197198]